MGSGGKGTGTLLTTVWKLEAIGCLGSPNSIPHKMSPFHCPVLRLCAPPSAGAGQWLLTILGQAAHLATRSEAQLVKRFIRGLGAALR